MRQEATTSRNVTRQVLCLLGTVTVIVVNALANALPINGRGTGEISDSFAVLFVPAGYVFAIWGVIYLGLMGFAIFQALPSQRDSQLLAGIDYLYLVTCAANVLWILLWHYLRFGWTLLVMVVLLLSLIAIYPRLGIGRGRPTRVERWLVRVPFSVYLGWITVATIANASAVLDYWSWGGWGLGPETWAVVMTLAAAAITAIVAVTRRDVAFVLAVTWALAGITVKQAAVPSVAITVAVLAAAVMGVLIYAVVAFRRRQAAR